MMEGWGWGSLGGLAVRRGEADGDGDGKCTT